jgi:hypothetical protein
VIYTKIYKCKYDRFTAKLCDPRFSGTSPCISPRSNDLLFFNSAFVETIEHNSCKYQELNVVGIQEFNQS